MATSNVSLDPLSEKERNTVPAPLVDVSDSRAHTIAMSDFRAMEAFRQQNHDRRFANADQLYLAWEPQKVWEGTRIPRSSLGIYLAFEQIEALLPAIMSSLFPLHDNVEVWPRPGTSMDQARAVYNLLLYQFDSLGEDGYKKLRETIRLCLKQAFVYGNGILELGWLYRQVARRIYAAQWEPEKRPIYDPVSGAYVMASTGKMNRKIQPHDLVQTINHPLLNCIDIRDFYIDPNTPSPSIQDARMCATRHLLTVDEVLSWAKREGEGFKIPNIKALIELAHNKTATQGDQMKSATETYRGAAYSPTQDYTQNPSKLRVEVIRWFSRENVVWSIGREWCALNRCNDAGMLPFLNAVYADVPGRFYGLAITDVVEGEQRLQQTIINGRVDELALTLHAPFIKKRGSGLTQGSLRVAPGKVLEFDNPKEDFIKVEYPGITASAYMEVQASDNRAQRTTGLSDLAVLGTPGGQGNSANRTATGISTQAAATSKRIQYIVENLETTLIEPLFAMCHDLNKKFIAPDQVLMVLGPDGQSFPLDPLDVMNANVRFQMRASAKVASRSVLLQAMPMLAQVMMNPALLQQMAGQGITLDLKELSILISEALNRPPMTLFRPMTQDEQQNHVMSNPVMQKFMADQELQQQRMSTMSQMNDSTNETKLLHGIFTGSAGIVGNPKAQEELTGLDHPGSQPPQPKQPKAKGK